MKKIFFLILIIVLTFTCSYAKSRTIDVSEDVKVGLFYDSSAKSSFTISSPGGIEIGTIDSDGDYTYEDETERNESITITKGSKQGSVYIEGYGEIGSRTEYPYFKSLEKDGISIMIIEGKKYRGNVLVRRFSESDMTVINHVSMQEYLYGVVPREIGGNSNIEAVKAQAIIARTYATKNIGKRSNLGFDFVPTTSDQAYGGYEWEVANSNRAVDETDGMVAIYDGELIGGYYFSTSGGYTENSENVWSGVFDYLKAVPDTYEPDIEGNTTWEVTMSADEVKTTLAKNGVNVGDIVDIVPIELADTGRILKLKIIGTAGEKILEKQQARNALGLKSQWFSVNDEAPEVKNIEYKSQKEIEDTSDEEDEDYDPEWFLKTDEEEGINKVTDYSSDESKFIKEYDDGFKDKEENLIIEKKPLLTMITNLFSSDVKTLLSKDGIEERISYKARSNRNSFIFRGRGFGHAVGMSQNGAKGMAKAGFSAEEIIGWYYRGVTIQK